MSTQPDPDFLTRLGEIPDPASSSPAEPPLRAPSLLAAPSRSKIRRMRLTALVGSLAWLGVHLAVYGVRTDFASLSVTYVVAQILLPFALAAGSLYVAFGSGKLGLGPKVALVSALAVLGPASFCAVAVGAPPPRTVEEGTSAVVDTVLCFDLTLAWIAVPLLCAALVLRSAFATSARWRSALVGAGIGLLAGATMNLHCSIVTPEHLLFGHGLAVVIAATLGGLLLSWRTQA